MTCTPLRSPLILGVDPSTHRTGWALLAGLDRDCLLNHGTIRDQTPLGVLAMIRAVEAVAEDHLTSLVLAVEDSWAGRNPGTAKKLGYAVAAWRVLAEIREHECRLFIPAEWRSLSLVYTGRPTGSDFKRLALAKVAEIYGPFEADNEHEAEAILIARACLIRADLDAGEW